MNIKQEYLNSIENPNTKRSYKRALEEFFGTGEITLDQIKNIKPIDTQNYLNQIKDKSPGTIQNRFAALSAFFEWAVYIYQLEDVTNYFNSKFIKKSIKKQKQKQEYDDEIQILTQKEIDKLLTVAKQSNFRDYVLFRFMLNTGLRRSEVTTIERKHFHKIKNEWFLILKANQTKGTKDRKIFIQNDLKEQIDQIAPKGRIFPMSDDNIYKLLIKYCKQAGIKKDITPHVLRHTSISYALMNGADVLSVQEFAGHSSFNTTLRYLHFINKTENSASRKLNFK